MAHDDQFTATGPSFTGAGFPRAGFSTRSDDTVHGVNVQGTVCGVYGEALQIGSNREVSVDGVGVFGRGHRFGVFGEVARGVAGVFGEHRRDGAGVMGVTTRGNRGGGVVGLSLASVEDRPSALANVPDPADGSGTGVMGSSGSGAGVKGTSDSGPGMYARSVSGPAIDAFSEEGEGARLSSRDSVGATCRSEKTGALLCVSKDGRGAVFESRKLAQINLTPIVSALPPREGLAGDVIAIATPGNPPQDALVNLWVCVLSGTVARAATWGKIQFSEIRQGG